MQHSDFEWAVLLLIWLHNTLPKFNNHIKLYGTPVFPLLKWEWRHLLYHLAYLSRLFKKLQEPCSFFPLNNCQTKWFWDWPWICCLHWWSSVCRPSAWCLWSGWSSRRALRWIYPSTLSPDSPRTCEEHRYSSPQTESERERGKWSKSLFLELNLSFSSKCGTYSNYKTLNKWTHKRLCITVNLFLESA